MKKKDKINSETSNGSKLLLIISLILILGGSAIFLYPEVSNYFAEKNQSKAIRKYDTSINELNTEELERELREAQIYNENLSGDPVHDPFVMGSGYALPENYKDVLNITDDGIMGYVEIPKISVYLAIYHGTSEDVLEKGVGHIDCTSLPIGGNSTHSVLTGHTGLPSAELFTRLDELQIGDIFYVHVLGETLTYKVYKTKVILPQDIDELQITDSKDLVTLVTCTPYGVNSHRLLVKAQSVEYEPYVEKEPNSENSNGEEIISINYYFIGAIIGISIFIIILTIMLIYRWRLRRRRYYF